MLDGTDRVQTAIQRLRSFEPLEGYFLAFSGGKDSLVIKTLADMAGVRYEAHYNVTTVDPPELIYYIRQHHPDVIFDLPERTMWELIVDKKIPPSRTRRYCCEVLKENNGIGRIVVTGVRWAESVRRRKRHGIVSTQHLVLNNDNNESRRFVEQCYRTHKTMLNPIIDWTDSDVWNFIRDEGLPYCCLYDEGFARLGCIGCPMATRQQREIQFTRWPRYRDAYIRTFDRMLAKYCDDGVEARNWHNPSDVMRWWMSERSNKQVPGQMELEAMT